jgi:xanthine dehydrogenase YagS FAD-binding subunit
MSNVRTYERPRTWTAVRGDWARRRYIAGGTDLVPLMRSGVERPEALVDLRDLVADDVRVGPAGVAIGAMATMTDVASHALIEEHCPAVAQALLAGASPQVRNTATIGGNLLQRTRCGYFRAPMLPCNKRALGSGCPAHEGNNRRHAIFGGSERCIAVHASDLAVALCALGARIVVRPTTGALRRLRVDDFYLLPEHRPDRETVLEAGEAIHSVEVPIELASRCSTYLKVRDRASFDFALVSAAVGLSLRDGVVDEVRMALGGVGTRPWRLRAAEARLIGRPLDTDEVRNALADLERTAHPTRQNAFKIDLARRVAERAVMNLAGAT